MEGLKVYRVQIYRRESRAGAPIDPLEEVVVSEMGQKDLQEHFLALYSGFSVLVFEVKEVERVKRPAKPEPGPGEIIKEKDTWIRGCRLLRAEITPELEAAIKAYGNAKVALGDAGGVVKDIVRSIEIAKPLVHEVNLNGMKIDYVAPVGVSDFSIMLTGSYLQELGAEEEKT